MIHIGKYNELKVSREVDFGMYLTDDDGNEVLIPAKYVPEGTAEGDTLRVFVYTDSEDRPVATTEVPFATVGECAYLQVRDVNEVGAFLDWGVTKDILVPFSEQRARMKRGGIYLVYVYLDHATMRPVATAKVDKYIGNAAADYRSGAAVDALVVEHTEIGYRTIVDNKFWGMIYENELFRPLELEQTVKAYVKTVRSDGKIDLTLSDRTDRRIHELAERILKTLATTKGSLALHDHSAPEVIQSLFSCSKKDFKKAIGRLYREGRITIAEDHIELV